MIVRAVCQNQVLRPFELLHLKELSDRLSTIDC